MFDVLRDSGIIDGNDKGVGGVCVMCCAVGSVGFVTRPAGTVGGEGDGALGAAALNSSPVARCGVDSTVAAGCWEPLEVLWFTFLIVSLACR